MVISLKNNKGFTWFSNEKVFVKGYFFDKNNCFYENEKAVIFLQKIASKKDFVNLLEEINGVFSFFIKTNEIYFVASDLTRSFPLFYSKKKETLFFSDNASYLKQKLNLNNFNSLATTELLASNHTYGNKTLLKNVFQVQASEYLIIKNDEIIHQDFFFSYATEKTSLLKKSQLEHIIYNAIENAFKRLINSLQGKPVVIPLSGGFDSRLIAVMFKKNNYNNVYCYTYGNKNSTEIKNSKDTAKKLGFKWKFIAYSNSLIENYINSNAFKEYAHYAGKYSSMPNLQEYFAIKYLSKNKLIPKNAVFIPGYAGDLLGGSQFIKVIPSNLKTENIISLIFNKKFLSHFTPNKQKNIIYDELHKIINSFNNNYRNMKSFSVFEDFDIKEKIAKYIFNSASFYTFFNYEHRFPFWDKEVLETFKTIPFEYKEMKHLFDDILINKYFKPHNVHFQEELQPSQKTLKKQHIKDIIKPFLPYFIKKYFLLKNDWNNYAPITSQMIDSMKKNNLKIKRPIKSYNEIITQWYVYFANEKIK